MDQRVDAPAWPVAEDSTLPPAPGTADRKAGRKAPDADSTAQLSPARGDTPPKQAAPAVPPTLASPGSGRSPATPGPDPAVPAAAAPGPPPFARTPDPAPVNGFSSPPPAPPMPVDNGPYPAGGYASSYSVAASPGSSGMPMPEPFQAQEQRGPVGSITAPFAALTRARRNRREAAAQVSYGQSGYDDSDPEQSTATRRAQLVLARIEPWSVMKFSFMISLVGWVILFVAVAVLYYALSKLGVFTAIEHTVGSVTSGKNTAGTNAASWFAASRILGYTMLAGAVNVVLITIISTLGAVIYNLITHLAGGIEVTLKETD